MPIRSLSDTLPLRFRWCSHFLAIALCGILGCLVPRSAAAEPAIDGYSNFAEFSRQVQALAKPEICAVRSLAKSPGGREVWLVTIGAGKPEAKPAILVVGSAEAAHLVGSELAVRIARQLVEASSNDKRTRELLERFTFYIIPRPNPDGSEAFFERPSRERAGNARPTDDDRDHKVGEDPADDLNGDGLITMMRVEDPAGKYLPHPDDERVMIEADTKKNERGKYSLYTEGKDDDHDEQFNEDGSGGVSFNRNFTFRYPYFKAGAGPHQVAEPETRAVADFAFDHSNIAAVFCFSPEDNLMHPWKPASEEKRIKMAVLAGDAGYMDPLAEKYRSLHGGKDAPSSPQGEGSFGEWAYFHYGRWSFIARGWWIPRVEQPTAGDDKKPDGDKEQKEKANNGKSDDKKNGAADKKSDDKKSAENRRAELVNALRWFEREKIDGFVPWKQIEHPDFPNKKVEVGGVKPFLILNPPAKELDALADKHRQFLIELAGRMPELKLSETKVEPLGSGVYRVACTVINSGYLPTMSEMGKTSGQPYPLQIELDLPDKTVFVQGTPRSSLDRLTGGGGKAEKTWLVRTPDGKPATGKIHVYAPAVGRVSATVELK